MRSMFLALVLALAACGPTVDPDTTAACARAAEPQACPECADGDVTCSLDGVTVTELSCGGCQARVALVQALCDAGSEVTDDAIDGAVCELEDTE